MNNPRVKPAIVDFVDGVDAKLLHGGLVEYIERWIERHGKVPADMVLVRTRYGQIEVSFAGCQKTLVKGRPKNLEQMMEYKDAERAGEV